MFENSNKLDEHLHVYWKAFEAWDIAYNSGELNSQFGGDDITVFTHAQMR